MRCSIYSDIHLQFVAPFAQSFSRRHLRFKRPQSRFRRNHRGLVDRTRARVPNFTLRHVLGVLSGLANCIPYLRAKIATITSCEKRAAAGDFFLSHVHVSTTLPCVDAGTTMLCAPDFYWAIRRLLTYARRCACGALFGEPPLPSKCTSSQAVTMLCAAPQPSPASKTTKPHRAGSETLGRNACQQCRIAVCPPIGCELPRRGQQLAEIALGG